MKGDIPTYIWKAIPCVTEKAGVVPTLSYSYELGTYAIQISTEVTVGNIRVVLVKGQILAKARKLLRYAYIF
jgi:ABC-type sulfate transport system permease subunit